MKTFLKLCASLIVGLPISTYAGEYFMDKVDSTLNWGLWYILLGAIAGGVASTFIKTEVDNRLSHIKLAKLVIGSFLGFFACVTWVAYYPDTEIMKLALPSFVLGCLGAPIIVFALTWASDPKTFNKAGKALDKRLGFEDEEDKK